MSSKKQVNSSEKKCWITPELKQFNKQDFIKTGGVASADGEDAGTTYSNS